MGKKGRHWESVGTMSEFHKQAKMIQKAPTIELKPKYSCKNIEERAAAKRGSKEYMTVVSAAVRTFREHCSA
jgi:hypothetical protein